ncbi:MAG: hypothetical protein LDL13_02780 [Calditerrivibrio sp.]|nr:hypothetical protein [Calditerrivibrio sp.]MCA1932486.1 hypothetical protein [Calditerrivibrio sp.]
MSFSIIKALANGMYLINLKGQTFTALFQNIPQFGKFNAEVVRTEPNIELKLLKGNSEDLENVRLKSEVFSFSRDTLSKLFAKYGFTIDPKNITAEKIKELIKNSGIFFENKLANGKDIDVDMKFLALKNNDVDLKDNLNKLQLINLLSDFSIYVPIKSEDTDLDDIELFIHKDISKGITIRAQFSKIGETIISVREQGNIIDCVVETAVDISEDINNLYIGNNIRLRWKKLEQIDTEELDIKKKIFERLGKFEIVV